MGKKITAFLLALGLVISCLQGCSNNKSNKGMNSDQKENSLQTNGSDTSKKTGEKKVMGRYMENKITLPELQADESIINIVQNSDKQFVVYTVYHEEYQCYLLEEGMTWEKGTSNWLNSAELKGALLTDICFDRYGNYYAVFESYGDNLKTLIAKSEDKGKTSKLLELSYLDKVVFASDDGEFYPRISKMEVLENGNLVVADLWVSNALLILSPEGEKLSEIPVGDTYNFITSGNQIVYINENRKETILYDSDTKENLKQIDYNFNGNASAFMQKEDGTLLLGDSAGIHRFMKDGTLWETTVDGVLNSMSMPSQSVSSLYVTEDGMEEYYVVYQDTESSYQLMHYVFDQKVAAIPENEITVYSLRENHTIRQAISLFQAEHADIKVNYVVAMEEESGNVNVTDYIRALNTELLAGKGADILVLDGLPVTSYIEKGVLMDLSDILNPIIESGVVLKNISDCYYEDGKVFRMPIRINIPIIIGKKEAITAADSLKGIADYINTTGKKPYSASTTYQKLLEDNLALYSRDLYQDGELKEEQLIAFLENLKVISDNIKAVEQDQKDISVNRITQNSLLENNFLQGDILSLLDDSNTSMVQIKNYYDAVLPFSLVKENGFAYSSIHQEFIPNGMVGINRASKETEIAKEFISFLFTEELQDADLFDGFPINHKSLDKWADKENDGFSLGISTKAGSMLTAYWPAKEERKAFMNLILESKEPIETDMVLNDMVKEEAIPFLKGETSASQAAAAVAARVNLYLSE